MKKNGSLALGKSPCHVCGRVSEAFNKKGKPVCITHYMKELDGSPIEKIGSVHPASLDDGIEKLAGDHRSAQ